MLAARPIMVGRTCFRFIQLEIIRQTSTPPTRTPAGASLPATGRSSSSAIPRKTLSSNSNRCLRMLLKWFMPVSHRIRYPPTILSKPKCSIRREQPRAAANEEGTSRCRTRTRRPTGRSQSSSPRQPTSRSTWRLTCSSSRVMNPISSIVTSQLPIAVRRRPPRPRNRARSSRRPPSARS